MEEQKTPRIPPINEAITRRAPVFVEDLQSDPRTLDPEFYRRKGLVSYLGLPLLAKGEVLGLYPFDEEKTFVQSRRGSISQSTRRPSRDCHSKFTALRANQTENPLELHYANRDLRRKEKIEALLKQLSQDITALDIDALLGKLTVQVREFLRVDLVDVRVLENGRWSIKGVAGAITPGLRSGLGQRRTGWILKNRRPLTIADIGLSGDAAADGSTENLGIRGYLGVPVFSRKGEIIGILRALSYQPREFTPEEVDLLEHIANDAGIALENAKLLDQIKTQTAQLQDASRVKDDFLRFVSHELKTPVNVVIGYAELLNAVISRHQCGSDEGPR